MTSNIIATGSSGNATIINDHILIDCGVSMKSLRPYIKELDIVLLTHQHSDHFKPSTVYGLHRARPRLRFGCCEWMAPFLISIGIAARNIDVFNTGKWYGYGEKTLVSPFPLVHNVPNCGWVIYDNSESVLYATDTGSMDGISYPGLDLYLIEANHTEAELEARAAAKIEAGIYSYEAAAAVNHLSRERALEWLSQNMDRHSTFVFMHQHVDHGGNQNAEQDDKGDDPHI